MSNSCKHIPFATRAGFSRRKVAGFTLLELMIVVGIIALLASIALASYGFANVKARRGAAEGCLEQASQYMERYYTTHFSYTDVTKPTAASPRPPSDACDAKVLKYYDVDFDSKSATAFKIYAAPISGVHKDPKCGRLTIDQVGNKTPDKEGCW